MSSHPHYLSIVTHFVGLKASLLDVDHCSRVFTSSCRRCSLLESVLVAIRLNNFVSSTKVTIVDEDIASGRSLTYRRKRTGPRINPLGAPEFTGKVEDVEPRAVTADGDGGGKIETS